MPTINIPELSPQEIRVLKFLVGGNTSKEIAKKMNLSVRTVESYRANIMKKTRTKKATELISFVIKHNLIRI